MKNKFSSLNLISTLLLSSSLLLISCAKSEKDPSEEPSPAPIELGEFSYTPSSGGSVKADSSYYIPAYGNIVTYKSGSPSMDITLSAMSVGTYSISPSTGISLTYTTGSTAYTASSGTIGITENTGSKLSGKFNVTLKGGSLTSLSGSFTDVPKR